MIYNEGMNVVNEKLSHITVYVRTISGQTISIRCDRRQNIARITKSRERKRSQKPLSTSRIKGKTLSEGK